MTEGLAAQISSIVRQQLADAHRMLGAMLDQLDGSGADLDTGTQNYSAPSPPAREIDAEPIGATAAPPVKTSTKPETIARRKRKRRAEARKAMNGANEPREAPAPEPDASWPELRQAVRDAAKSRGLTYLAIAAQLGAKAGTLNTWLSRDTPPPSERSISRVRKWLRELPATAPDADPADADPVERPPVYTLSEPEQVSLQGFLSLAADRELRMLFGLNREILGKASVGEHMAAEVVARVRTALANGAAAE
jgi:hypothetical protein